MAANDTQTDILRMYLNDMVALETDIHGAVHGQRDDERVKMDPAVEALVVRIHDSTRARLNDMEAHAAALKAGTGGMIKEAVAGVTGALAGLYGKVRKHPVSRMLRDDYTALSLAATAYSMLYTTALAFRDLAVANVALRHLRGVTPLIMELSDIIPQVVMRELAEDDPSIDTASAELARTNTREAWTPSGH